MRLLQFSGINFIVGFVSGTEPSEHVSNLVFAVEGRFVETDQAIARSQVLPDVFVRRDVCRSDFRARGKSPSPAGSTDKVRAHGFVETYALDVKTGKVEGKNGPAAHQRRVHCLSESVAQPDAVGEANPNRAGQSFGPQDQ